VVDSIASTTPTPITLMMDVFPFGKSNSICFVLLLLLLLYYLPNP